MSGTTWTIGHLAKRSGMSVRALRHYDEVGLLRPAGRTASGYRWYTGEEIVRLQRIMALRQMGFSLTRIRDLLEGSTISPREMVHDQMQQLQAHIALEQNLCARLDRLARRLSTSEEVSPEEFLEVIEVMNMVDNSEKYYTPEQLAWLGDRAETVGPERIRQVESEWPQLIAQVRAEMDRGTDPRDPEVQRLAARWRGLVEEFTGGNPEIGASLQRMYEHEPELRARTGVDPDIAAYIGRALAAEG